MRITYRRSFRLIGHFRAENQHFQNDSFFSNFDFKFLFNQSIDFAEYFFRITNFLWCIKDLKNIAGITLSAAVKN